MVCKCLILTNEFNQYGYSRIVIIEFNGKILVTFASIPAYYTTTRSVESRLTFNVGYFFILFRCVHFTINYLPLLLCTLLTAWKTLLLSELSLIHIFGMLFAVFDGHYLLFISVDYICWSSFRHKITIAHIEVSLIKLTTERSCFQTENQRRKPCMLVDYIHSCDSQLAIGVSPAMAFVVYQRYIPLLFK